MKSSTQRWFMPWRWNRWTWVVLPPFALLAYFLSAVPALRLSSQGLQFGSEFQYICRFYAPVWMIDAHSIEVATVIDWEDRVMDRILGAERHLMEVNPNGPYWYRTSIIEDQRMEYR